MNSVIQQLTHTLGNTQVRSGNSLTERATSYWSSEPTHATAIVYPRTTDEVSQVMAICYSNNQPVVVQGGLTGCVAGAVSQEQEIILSLEKMRGIESIDTIGSTATVQAGVILEVLQNTLADADMMFPLDLGARGSCTIGGNIATNAGGINVLRYGMMRDLVLGLEAVLADGTVISSMNQMMKNNAGYDLKQLFIGSEGTLGVVTRAVIKLFPLPSSVNCALVAVQDFSTVTRLLAAARAQFAGDLSAFEVMWGQYYRAVTEAGGHRPPLPREYPFYVVIETEGSNIETDSKRFNAVLEQLFDDDIVIDAVIPKSETERRAIWQVREDFETILEKKPYYLYDVSLPISDMPRYVAEVNSGLLAAFATGQCYVLGHVADGNLHLFICPGQAGDSREICDKVVYEPLRPLKGSVSAEHGIGTEKMAWLNVSRTDAEIVLMQRLKNLLDPTGVLNPNRVLS